MLINFGIISIQVNFYGRQKSGIKYLINSHKNG